MPLNKKFAEYIAKIKASGIKTLTAKAPCCGYEIEERAGIEGQTWDTLTRCPHCESLLYKVTTATTLEYTTVKR